MPSNFVQIATESEIRERLEAERARLRKIAGLDQANHFHRPVERAFKADERSRVTILFGGFTWKHEDLIRAVFQGCGYNCEKLPVPDVAGFQTGKEFGNNGLQSDLFHGRQPSAVSTVFGETGSLTP